MNGIRKTINVFSLHSVFYTFIILKNRKERIIVDELGEKREEEIAYICPLLCA
jgi:hypothetical protein